jgi:hypothetical protein
LARRTSEALREETAITRIKSATKRNEVGRATHNESKDFFQAFLKQAIEAALDVRSRLLVPLKSQLSFLAFGCNVSFLIDS